MSTLKSGDGELRVVLQRLGDVDQEVARQVAVDDVLLDIDEVIDAGVGLHVLDRLVVHLVPGRRLELDVDAGRLGEGRREHVLDVVRRRRALGNATNGHALVGRAASDQKSAWAVETAATTEDAAIAALIPSPERIGFSQILLWFVIVRRRRARWVSRCSCVGRERRSSRCGLSARSLRVLHAFRSRSAHFFRCLRFCGAARSDHQAD